MQNAFIITSKKYGMVSKLFFMMMKEAGIVLLMEILISWRQEQKTKPNEK